jgi:hypothetical protein
MGTRYQMGNQKPYLEGQRTQWSQDTKWVIRSRILKNREHNDQKKKDKGTNNDLQTITQKTKDRVTRTPLNSPCSIIYLNVMVVAIYII